LRGLIVADDPLARAGLATLLTGLAEIEIAARIASTDDVGAAVEIHQADIVLWDVGWKAEIALARLGEQALSVPVVALVEDADDAAHAWRAGAQGLLRRNAEPTDMEAALVAAARGLTVVASEFRAVLAAPQPPTLPHPSEQPPDDEPVLLEPLTPRELEVLRLVAEGLPNKTIARRLDISEHTVKFHINSLLGKLGVSSRTEAVVRATRLGLVFL
jgi:DNA-binding NarL/FixJ family response regulator